MNFIKKIFKEEIDEEVHQEFVRFSKGNFEERYLIEGKKQANQWKIKTSSEFANFFISECLKKVSGTVKVKGIIIATYDLSENIDFEFELKKYMGIQKYVVNTEVEKDKLIELMEKHPKVFYALSFKTPDCELKIKEKAPKSGKPSSKGDKKPKANFCTLKTKDKDIVRDLIFDVPDFKEVFISHEIQIEEIIYPDNMEQLKPEEVRESCKRKGKIIRRLVVDGKNLKEEKEFVA